MKILTVRVSDELHAAVDLAAWRRRTSVNKFANDLFRNAVASELAELSSREAASSAAAANGEAVRS